MIWLYPSQNESGGSWHGARSIARIRIDVSAAHQAPLDVPEAWNLFEATLSGPLPLPLIELVLGSNKSLLNLILEGKILSKIDMQKKLVLYDQPNGLPVSRHEVFDEPEQCHVAGYEIKLSLVGRFYFLARRDKNRYRAELLKAWLAARKSRRYAQGNMRRNHVPVKS